MNEHPNLPPQSAGPSSAGSASQGQHLATISEDGRFWEVYVEFDDDPTRTDSFGARLCFTPADTRSSTEAVRTTTILIESSYEEVLYRARGFEAHQLSGLLRSCLPD